MPYEKINLNCPECIENGHQMTMTTADKPEEVRCMQCVKHWLRDYFIMQYTGKGTVNPSHYPAVDLPPDRKPTAGDPYLGKCPHCMKDVRASQLSRTYPGEETLFHTECLIETMREIIEKRKETETPREAPIQTADQDKYKEQVSKAFTDLVMLLAFNKWSEESVRDILIRISSNCYAMGFQDGMDRK